MNSFPSYKGNRFDRWETDPPSEPMVVIRSPNGFVQPIDESEEGNPNPSDIPRLHKLNPKPNNACNVSCVAVECPQSSKTFDTS